MMAEDFCDFSQNAQKIKTEQNKNQIHAVRAGLVSNTEPHCHHIDYK